MSDRKSSVDGASRDGEVPEQNIADSAEQIGVDDREGGDMMLNLGGGVAASEVPIAEHALGQPSPPQTEASSSNLQTDAAMSTFTFALPPFSNPVQAEMSQLNKSNVSGGVPSSQPTASKDSQPGGDRSSVGPSVLPKLTAMSAAALAKHIGDKIPNFKPEAWIAEDVSGTAFLEVVSPSSLTEFLEQTALINSKFQRTRIENLLRELVASDKSIAESVRKLWATNLVPLAASNSVNPPSGGQLLSPAHPSNLFQTPAPRSQHGASFLSEIKGRVGFPLDNSVLFGSDSTSARASITGLQPEMSSGGRTSADGGPCFAITINQPSAEKPKYVILETCDNDEEFAKWLKKNREESLLALPVDRRALTDLITKDCKEEISRVIVNAARDDPHIFDKDAPYPNHGWPSVTEKLLLRVLFKKNGPPSASAAKDRLKAIRFFFNDSTTHQKLFTAKLRKHVKRFTSDLEDFQYSCRLWPEHDKDMSHTAIVEAFSEGFNDTSTVLGPDKTTQVSKCSNLAKIREYIREHKAKTLEEIIAFVVGYFERLDTTVRSNSKVKYDVTPWRQDAGGAKSSGKKRKFNQTEASVQAISASGGSVPPTPKVQRPPTTNPRCNNCGSKGHLCGERTCFLFGHSKAKGPDGNWPEGTPSLRLSPEEYKTWSTTRKPIFFGYPENQPKPKATGA